jgi:hypothetical protein
MTNKIDKKSEEKHPSKSLGIRGKGFGIASGFEKLYVKSNDEEVKNNDIFSAIPHSGYFGSGIGLRPFKRLEATFGNELDWYEKQYCEKTVKK